MNVGVCTLKLRLPDNFSLKDKRQVLRSVTSRVRNTFNVSVAEVDDNDLWQSTTIGISVVSNDKRHTDEVLSKIVNFVTTSRFEMEVIDCQTEIIPISQD